VFIDTVDEATVSMAWLDLDRSREALVESGVEVESRCRHPARDSFLPLVREFPHPEDRSLGVDDVLRASSSANLLP
jgi:hypothetical protein